MGISPEEFVAIHPRLFHMAEADTWPGIQRHGLLSTTALLDLFEINDNRRYEIEETNRRASVTINHHNHGTAVIRDQLPMTDSALQKCLLGMSPREWYRLLNSKVFFWASSDRLTRLFEARAYRNRRHCILVLDSARFLEKYNDRVELSPINSGSTLYRPVTRGRDTFLPLEQYPYAEWKKKRTASTAIVEVTVDYRAEEIDDCVLEVTHMVGDQIQERIV
jgi:hypothetical protein